jgi:hypothetical protein
MKEIFFTYSDNEKDIELYRQLNKHFAAYAKKGLIRIIDKEELFRLNNDKTLVETFLKKADLAVPLLSVDYVANDDCVKMLDIAADANKTIIPVLLRDFDWQQMEEIKKLENELLPNDKQSVNAHMSTAHDKDEVFADIAKKVKSVVFNDFDGITIKKKPGTFFYILATVVLVIGALAAIVSYDFLKDWKIAAIVFLMFGCISLFCVKNILFPTKFKLN